MNSSISNDFNMYEYDFLFNSDMFVVCECNEKYELHKLSEYSNCKKNEVVSRNGIIIFSNDELSTYVYDAFDNLSSKKDIHLGCLSKSTIERITNDINGSKKIFNDEIFNSNYEYDLSINQDTIRHIKKKSMSISDVDNLIHNLVETIINYDSVSKEIYCKKNEIHNGLRFKKKINGVNYVTFVIIYTKRKVLNTKTMFIDKNDYLSIKRNQIELLPMN